MPYKSDAQRRFFHTKTAKKAGITGKEVKEFDKESKGLDLPEYKNKEKGGIMKLADALKKKKEMDERKHLWRGGLSDKERDIMPVEVVGEDDIEEDRKKELGEHMDKLIEEAKKPEEPHPDMKDSEMSAEDKFLYAKGGEVPPKPMKHEPEHFSEPSEKERMQAAMRHLDSSLKKHEEPKQPEEMPHDQGSDPSEERPEMLAHGGVLMDHIKEEHRHKYKAK